MSSASSGRYQSRLFNFVHRQSRRLTQGCDRAFRHLQVATNAVVPVLLYPIYLLFQSTAAKQLHRAAQQSWTQLPVNNSNSLPKLPIDTPIQRVLQTVVSSESAFLTFPQDKKSANFSAFLRFLRFKFFPSGLDSRSNLSGSSPQITSLPISPSLNLPRPVIQGIATQLTSRTLVLVTAQNEILDITPQQQQKLQERIIAEVADYWRYQKLLGGQQAPKHLVSTSAIFLPVSLIAWVQEALALTSNVFPKSSLVKP
jgi:hypothetical protein